MMTAGDGSTELRMERPAPEATTPQVPRLSPKDELEHAWRYFALHAAQRLSMFNYFLILFGFTAAGMGSCLRAEGALRLAGVLLGAALTAIAYTFYKLDERTSFLIKHAENALRILEGRVASEEGRVFSGERGSTDYAKAVTGLWSYGRSFRLVFVVAGFVGVLAMVLATLLFLGRSTS